MNTPDSPTPEDKPAGPTKKLTPLETMLDEQKTKAFGLYLQGRVNSIKSQLESEFWAKRDCYAKQMEDDFSWRGQDGNRSDYADPDNVNDIFDLQNDSLNIVGGFAAFMTARTADDIFGTEPFYSINPEGMEDGELAADMQKHSEWKLRMSTFKEAALDALDNAMGLGEGILKLRWCTESDVYEVEQSVLHIDGKPFVTPSGEYITEADLMPFTPEEPEPVGTDPTMPEGMEMMEPAPVVPTELIQTSTKAPDLQIVGTPDFRPMAIERTNVSYNGVKAEVMHYRDFLCPLTTESLEDADFVGHRFQMRLSEAKQRFAISAEVLSQLQAESEEAKAEKDKPRDGETAESGDQRQIPDPVIEFVECWVKYDPMGDGKLRRCYVLLAVSQGLIVEMDYIANRTPQGQLPFFVVRAYKVKNRWYGRGYYEIYGKAQEFIDRQLNRVEYRNRFHSNPPKGIDRSQFSQDQDQEIKLQPGESIDLQPGKKLADAIQTIELPDLDERTWQLMQFMIQTVQVRSGITSAAQGEVSSMPSTATATGIESILQSASVLARLPMGLIRHSLERALLYAVKLIYANFDRDEVFTYFEGDTQKAATLAAERVQNIDMNVRLLLTRFKQRESVESGQKAVEAFTAFAALPPQMQVQAAPLYVQIGKGLGIEQADAIFAPMVPPPQPQLGPGQPPEQGGNVIPMEPQPNAAAQAGLPGIPAEAAGS